MKPCFLKQNPGDSISQVSPIRQMIWAMKFAVGFLKHMSRQFPYFVMKSHLAGSNW